MGKQAFILMQWACSEIIDVVQGGIIKLVADAAMQNQVINRKQEL